MMTIGDLYVTVWTHMDVALIVAGSLAVLGAAVHGVGGDLLVVRKLEAGALPPSRFGGPSMTRAMIHVTWHIATVAFLVVGCALVLAGSVLDGAAAQGIAIVAAAATSGFAAVTVILGGADARSPHSLLSHPGPPVLIVTAVLAWVGAL